MARCYCQAPVRKLTWNDTAPNDFWGVRWHTMRRNTHAAMISGVWLLGKMLCTKLDLSQVYQCTKCGEKWRTWFK